MLVALISGGSAGCLRQTGYCLVDTDCPQGHRCTVSEFTCTPSSPAPLDGGIGGPSDDAARTGTGDAAALDLADVMLPPLPAKCLAYSDSPIPLGYAGSVGDLFGSSASADGDWLVVGAPGRATQRGAVVLYWRGDAYSAGQIVQVTDGAAGDRFGAAVALRGDALLVGAPGRGGTGAVYALIRSGKTWSAPSLLTAPAALPTSAALGSALAVLQDQALAGAPGAGRTFRYQRNGGLWNSAAEVTAPSGLTPADRFGAAVALTSTAAFIAAPAASSQRGQVFSYASGGQGSPSELFLGSLGARSGESMAADADRLLIGLPGVSADRGLALLFERSAMGPFVQSLTLSTPDAQDGDLLGRAVAAQGDWLLAGLPGRTSSTGRAARCNRSDASTITTPRLLSSGRPETTQGVGSAVTLSIDGLVVGAPTTNSSMGAAYRFICSG